MKVLVLGASGNTGKLLVRELLKQSVQTRVLIREGSFLEDNIINHDLVEVVRDSISEMGNKQMDQLIKGCSVVVSCLGHNLSFKGMYGRPRKLVVNAVKGVCDAVKRAETNKIKLILMSTTAYTNRSINEKNSLGEKLVVGLIHLLLPPHRDNIKAANYLVNEIKKNHDTIKWVAVRPDTLIDIDQVTPYDIKESPVRSPIFNAGKTSRINVSHFIAELINDEEQWNKWVFTTPVIYNQ